VPASVIAMDAKMFELVIVVATALDVIKLHSVVFTTVKVPAINIFEKLALAPVTLDAVIEVPIKSPVSMPPERSK
jgi:hypothetical protein